MLLNGIFIPSFIDENNNNKSNDAVDVCGSDVVAEQPKSKVRRLQKNWILEKTFENRTDAMAAINAEKTWSYGYDNDASNGKRITFRCNKVINY